MPRFVSSRDFNLIQHFNREILNDIVDVDVILYKIALDTTSVNLYGEATEKARYTGVELKSLVKYKKNIADTASGFGVDIEQDVEFRFARNLLEEVNVYPEIGDIIHYDDSYYEIDNINDTQYVAGQPYNSLSILCDAHLTRISGLNIEEPGSNG
jgi:hypothetical protein